MNYLFSKLKLNKSKTYSVTARRDRVKYMPNVKMSHERFISPSVRDLGLDIQIAA